MCLLVFRDDWKIHITGKTAQNGTKMKYYNIHCLGKHKEIEDSNYEGHILFVDFPTLSRETVNVCTHSFVCDSY